MPLRFVRMHLLPGSAEQDVQFRQEIGRLASTGLWITGAVELAAGIVVHWSVAAIGAATLAAARGTVRHRETGLASLALAGALLALVGGAPEAGIALLVISGAAVLPLLPLQTLAAAIAIDIVYAVAGHRNYWFMLLVTIAAAGISAAVYQQRLAAFRRYQDAVRISEALSGAQLRAQLAESAVAIGKLAAALTHEINTPLGTLKSSVDTLLVVAGRQATASPEQQPRLVTMQAELRKSVQTSSERIQNVVARLQRFVNLHEAELQSANLNELISDVAMLFEPQIKDKIKLELHLEPLPTLTCRPQLLTAVISSLLSNAINAVDGDGRIVVSSRRTDSAIELRIEDNGRGMTADELETAFDPGFKVEGSRVSSGNWSLFNSRQVVFEHGGNIEIESEPGKGTAVILTLPC